MSAPRSCPHCKKSVPISSGFVFDDDLNMICLNCSKVMFPANVKSEDDFDYRKRKNSVGTPGFQTPHTGGVRHNHLAGNVGYNGVHTSRDSGMEY